MIVAKSDGDDADPLVLFLVLGGFFEHIFHDNGKDMLQRYIF